MKKMKQVNVLIILLSMTLLSCKKEKVDPDAVTIEVTLKNSEEYRYSLGFFGDEEGTFIEKQATHFEVSTILGKHFDERVYQYKPQEGYVGKDTVVIITARGSDEASPNNDRQTITINFTIAN